MVETFEPYLLGQDPARSSTTSSTCTAPRTSWARWSRARSRRSTSRSGTSRASASACRSTSCWAARPATGSAATSTSTGDDARELAADAQTAAEEGFTAVRFSAVQPGLLPAQVVRRVGEQAVERVGAVREAVGPDVDVCVEIHRQMNPPSRSRSAGGSSSSTRSSTKTRCCRTARPGWATSRRTATSRSRPASGSRRIFEFQQLLENKGCAYVRPDLCLCGGISRLQEGRRAWPRRSTSR